MLERSLAHLVITWDGAVGSRATRTKSEARAIVDQAHARIAAGAAFADVARELSEDESASRGGALGRIGPGQLPPALEATGFALDVGQVSGVVESPLGFHLLLRTE